MASMSVLPVAVARSDAGAEDRAAAVDAAGDAEAAVGARKPKPSVAVRTLQTTAAFRNEGGAMETPSRWELTPY